MSDEQRDPQVPGVSNTMPGEKEQTSVAGAAQDDSAIGRVGDADEPGLGGAASGSGGDSVAGDDDLGRGDEEPSRPVPDDDDVLGASGPQADNPASKEPSQWVTGDEPLTSAQRSYLDTLAREAGEEVPANLTKAEASEQIDRLQAKTGRGQ